jgi:hypothetical protein
MMHGIQSEGWTESITQPQKARTYQPSLRLRETMASKEKIPEAALSDGEGKTMFEPTAREASLDGGYRSCIWSMRCGSSSSAQGEELRIPVWAPQERSITAA